MATNEQFTGPSHNVLETDGIDTQFNWRGDVGGNPMSLNVIMSTVSSYKIQPTPECRGSTNPGYYDVLGRRYYAGLRFSF